MTWLASMRLTGRRKANIMDGFILVIEDDEPRLQQTEAAEAYTEIGSRRGQELMRVTRFLRSLFMRVAIAAVIIWFIDPARAATFAIGPATSHGSLALGNEALLAQVADTFMLQSGAGASFESSPFVTTGHVGRSAIFEVNGANFSSGQLLQADSAQMHHTLAGLPSRDYWLVFGDSATFFDPIPQIPSSQVGSIDIAATSPVPEPHAKALLLNGAVLLAWHLYRRRMKKRDAGW